MVHRIADNTLSAEDRAAYLGLLQKLEAAGVKVAPAAGDLAAGPWELAGSAEAAEAAAAKIGA